MEKVKRHTIGREKIVALIMFLETLQTHNI